MAYGTGSRAGVGAPRDTQLSTRKQRPRKTKQSFDLVQELDSTNAIEIFQSTTTKGKSAMASPQQLTVSNQGQAAIGVTLQVPIWTDDTTQSGSNYLQFILPVGAELPLPTTQIVDSLNANFMDGTVVSNTAPNSNMYVDSTADTTEGFADDNDTTITFDDASGGVAHNMFRVNDLIRIDNEVCRITSIVDTAGDGLYTPAHFIVERALYGTAKADHSNNAAIRLPFFNMYADFDKYSTSRTNKDGRFKAMNFFGYGRATTIAASGIVPGSINIKFYKQGYQELGMSGVTLNTHSGLAASTAYTFNITADGGSVFVDLSFTTDSSNLNFGGVNGILNKIQDALNTQYYTAGNLFEKKVTVGLVNGDVRFTSGSRLSTSAILIAAPGSGTTPFGVGRLPAIANVQGAVATKLPDDVKFNRTTYEEVSNTREFMYDDGAGSLVGGAGSGTINYETGEINFLSYPDAEFVINVAHSSGLAGRASSSGANIIEKIYARSASAKIKGHVGLMIK